MKLMLHISPTRTHSTRDGVLPARVVDQVDEVAASLRAAGADVEILEAPASDHDGSDFSLIFAPDLQWQLNEGKRAADRLVVLHADRDQILELVETYRVAAAVFYIHPDALNKPSNGLVIPRAGAEKLGGTLGPGAPYFMSSEHYAAWTHPDHPTLGARLVAYLKASMPAPPVVVNSKDAEKQGLAPITIRMDARSAGMGVRLFPTKDTYCAFNGPPGAPISIVIWDCTNLPHDVEAVIRAKLVPPWTNMLELGASDHGTLLGGERAGMTYATGSGRARMVWFGVLAKHNGATALVSVGVSGSEGRKVRAEEILSNAMIRAAVATLEIE